MKPCDSSITFHDFGLTTTADLLDSAAEAVTKALKSPDPEAVHKGRVAIRRFQQSLRLFDQFLRKKGVKQVRRELKSIMTPAGELRNCDIAIGLLRRAKADATALKTKRLEARSAFLEALGEVAQADPADRWRKSLELPAE